MKTASLGNGARGGAGDGQFTQPFGIAFDSSGNVFVADISNSRIQKFDSEGQFISKFGTFGAGDGQFFSPSGVAINSSDEIYVVDFSASGNRVQQFSANGTFIRKWGTGGSANGQFQNPRCLTVGPGGEVYVSDYGNDRIQVFQADGVFLQAIGATGSGDGQLSFPDGIAVDGSGNIFVVDRGNHRVQVFNSSGAFVRKWGAQGTGDGQFDSPTGLALGADGVVYVADFNNDRVQAFTTSGVFLGKWGTAGNGDGQFQGPSGVAVTAAGRVYVSNSDAGVGNRVQYFDPIWNVTMDEDGVPAPFALTLSAFDADADTLTWSISSGASNGTADASGTGTSKAISYTPNVDFNGADNFDVQINDGNAGTATRTVYVTINPINDGPTIDQAPGPLQVTMSQDGNPTPFVAPVVTATDPEGDTITWSVSSAASHGTATVSGTGVIPSTFTYVPTAGYTGSDSFTIQASDGSLSDTIVVDVTIEVVAEPPVIDQGVGPLMVEMDEDGIFSAPTLSATDADTGPGGLTWSVASNASFGFAEVSGTGAAPATFTYTPATDYFGPDSFTVEVSDGVLTDSIIVNVAINPINDAPVIFQGDGPLTVTMSEDGTPTDFVRPTLYATDVDDDTLTWSVASPAANGTATVNGSGSSATVLDYTPDADFAGTDSFMVQVSDGVMSDTIVIEVTVEAVADPPVIDQGSGPIEVTMDEDAAFPAPALSATDPDDGGTLTWTLDAAATSGVAVVSGTGTTPTVFSYTPNENFSGSDSFSVTVSDGTNSDSITVNVTVAPVNDDPVIEQGTGPLQVTMSEDGVPTAFTAPALSASDVDDDTLSWAIEAQPANGEALASGIGASPTTLAYAPDADFSGVDTFVVRVSDGTSSDSITIEVTVEAENDAPSIDQGDGPVEASFDQGGSTPGFRSGALSASDVDNEATALTWSLLTPPTEGSAEVSGSGATPPTYTYTVREDFLGADSFVVQVSDGTLTDTVTVHVAVVEGNDWPVITQGDNPIEVVMDEDGAPTAFVAPAIGATDPEDDPLTWSLGSPPSNGTATVSGDGASPTTLTYAPNANFNGEDAFTVQVSDGHGGTDTIEISVTINPVNDPVVITQGAGPLTSEMTEDGDFSAPELSATDIDGDTLSWSVAVQAASGVATVSGDGSSPAIFQYVPGTDFNGNDSFEVAVTDNAGSTATIPVNVTVTPVNDGPVIAQGTAVFVAMDEDGAFTAPELAAIDVDGDTLTWSLSVAAEHGVATAEGTGASPSTLTYAPELNYNGEDRFTLTVEDGNGGAALVEILVTVNPTNDAPVIEQGAGPLAVVMEEDGEFSAPEVSATDLDGDTLTWSISTAASHGVATATGNGATPTLGYVPASNFAGSDSFVVVVSDNNGGTDAITIEVTLTPVQDAPEIEQGDSVSVTMSEDGSPTAFVAPTITAIDADGDSLTWSLSADGTHGTATATGSGVSPALSYAPEANYFGSDSFTVEVSDENNGTDTITVHVTISPVSDGITISQGDSVSVTMSENGAPTAFVAPTIGATGLENEYDMWVWSISSPPSHGAATATGTGASPATLTYTPTRNFEGEDTFTVQVSDGIGGADQIVVEVTVEHVNGAPVIAEYQQYRYAGEWAIPLPAGATRHDRMSLAIGPNNNVYVGEQNRIQIYDADGNSVRTFTPFLADSLAVDGNGAVYGLFQSPLVLAKFLPNGLLDLTWPAAKDLFPAGQIHTASTVSVTPGGLARFVQFSRANANSVPQVRLRGLTATGALGHTVGLSLADQDYATYDDDYQYRIGGTAKNFDYVAATDAAGNTYVRQQNYTYQGYFYNGFLIRAERVYVYNAAGLQSRSFDMPSVSSTGRRYIAVQPNGQRLFVSESDRNRVEVLTGTGTLESPFGGFGSGEGRFTTISGLAVNGNGRVYVSDTAAGRVQYFERTRVTDTVEVHMYEDGTFTFPLTATDPDGDRVTWAIVRGPGESGTEGKGESETPNEGTATGGTTVRYTPPPNFNGETSFVVAAQDGKGGSTEVFVRVIIQPVEDTPVITQGDRPISVVMSKNGTPVAFQTPALSATDGDGDLLTWSLVNSKPVRFWYSYFDVYTLGTISGSATGPVFDNYTYTPGNDFTGYDSFTVRVTDSKGNSDSIEIHIAVSAGSSVTPLEYLAELLREDFDGFDIDQDGSISALELTTAFPGTTQEQFEELDADGDGFISQAELEEVDAPHSSFGCNLPAELKSFSDTALGRMLNAIQKGIGAFFGG